MDKGLFPASEEYEFLKLAKKFAEHYHEEGLSFDPQICLVCEAIRDLDRGQMRVADMLDGRKWHGTEDADDLRTMRPS